MYPCARLSRANSVCGIFFALAEKNLLDGALSPRVVSDVTAGSEGDMCYRHDLGIFGARQQVQPGSPASEVSGAG